jgi:hypothetical protein
MLVFVAVIGPLNLLILSRMKKRMWLLWTVPLISALTCLGVSAYTIASEGLSAHGRTVAFTILDETSHRATTLGLMAFYSPLTPGDGLHFSYDTEVSTLEREYYYGQRSLRIDWTEDQHLASGWVTARAIASFQTRRSETRRERIAIRHEAGGSVTVVNGLGVPIRRLWVADKKGLIHEVANLDAGDSAVMAQTGRWAVGSADQLSKLFSESWQDLATDAEARSRWLRPDCYLAELESSSFVEEGLQAAGDRRVSALVYGIMKGTPE